MLDLKSRDCPYIIAESGTNHASRNPDERLSKALLYVRAAVECQADAIKFQMFKTPIVQPDMFCWIDGDEERSERWGLSEMTFEEWEVVKMEAEAFGLAFLVSAFQHSTVRWLNDLGVVATKVASRATTRFPYEDAPKPWLISTGMGYPPEVAFDECQDGNAMLIQCESKYPSTQEWDGEPRLPGFPPLEGFSDHSADSALAIDAMRRGCKLIEVHFMIDPADAGPDLPASLTLDQLKAITRERNAIACP